MKKKERNKETNKQTNLQRPKNKETTIKGRLN